MSSNQQRLDIAVEEPDDVDLLVVEYRTEAELSRAKHILLVAGLEFFLPHLKNELVWSRESIKGRQIAEPSNHMVPLPNSCALLFAAYHAARGGPRVGAAVLLQRGTGSEVLGIREQRVSCPLCLDGNVAIRLGVDVSTKVERERESSLLLFLPAKSLSFVVFCANLFNILRPKHAFFPLAINTTILSWQSLTMVSPAASRLIQLGRDSPQRAPLRRG